MGRSTGEKGKLLDRPRGGQTGTEVTTLPNLPVHEGPKDGGFLVVIGPGQREDGVMG